MTYRDLLTQAASRLESADILFCDTPLLDASVLLAFAADITKEKLLASYPEETTEGIRENFKKLMSKRLSGIPVSYITNKKEFYGRDFYVDKSVLIPRPDTEILVEKTLQIAEDKPLRLLDLCTGSGCIAISLKLEAPRLDVTASDISQKALKTASDNAARLQADIKFKNSSLFDDLEGNFDIIATNPPYLTSDEINSIFSKGWSEPVLALEGGEDGLDFIRIIVKSALDYLNDNGYLLIESGEQQTEVIASMLSEKGYSDIEITEDLAGRKRVTSGRKSGS